MRYLVRMIDDATSWSWGRFVERDATRHNMAVLWEYLEKNGRMVEVYTDRDSMFTTARRGEENRAEDSPAERLTQIGRGLRELGIGWIAAYSPQAKGRIERSFLTAQDRLVKQLRLARISTMEAANAFLEKEYWPEWNTRFARRVEDFPNHHRPLTEQLELAAMLCHVEPRVIGNDYTFSFAGRRYQIARAQTQTGMRRQSLRVELRLDGELRRATRVDTWRSLRAQSGPWSSRPPHPNRPAKTTIAEERVRGWKDSSTVPARRCGKPSTDEPILCAGLRPSIFAWYSPKPPLGSFTKSRTRLVQESPPRGFQPLWRACADCFRSQLRRLGFGHLARRDPSEAVRTYHEGSDGPSEIGTCLLWWE